MTRGASNKPGFTPFLPPDLLFESDELKIEKLVSHKSGKTRIQVKLPDGGWMVMDEAGWKLWDVKVPGRLVRKGSWTTYEAERCDLCCRHGILWDRFCGWCEDPEEDDPTRDEPWGCEHGIGVPPGVLPRYLNIQY
jgi:hypothetical protein